MHFKWCELLLQTVMWFKVCVCLSVGHIREPYKNGWTKWDAIWGANAGGPKDPCTRWVSTSPRERTILGLSASLKSIGILEMPFGRLIDVGSRVEIIGVAVWLRLVRQAAMEQFCLTVTRCVPGQKLLVYFITLLFTVLTVCNLRRLVVCCCNKTRGTVHLISDPDMG